MKKKISKILCVVGAGILVSSILSQIMYNPYHIGLLAGACAICSLELFKDA
jgi:hypothetical protein